MGPNTERTELLAIVLLGLGQFPAALLLVIALLLGWWGKRRLASEEPAIR